MLKIDQIAAGIHPLTMPLTPPAERGQSEGPRHNGLLCLTDGLDKYTILLCGIGFKLLMLHDSIVLCKSRLS